MKFVSLPDLRDIASDLWKQLEREGDIVVTSDDKPIAILSAADEDSYESCIRALQLARLGRVVETLQRDAASRGIDKLTMEEIDAEIAAYRRERKAH